jgi:hypothetical protein
MSPEWAQHHVQDARTDSRTLAPAAFPSLPLDHVHDAVDTNTPCDTLPTLGPEDVEVETASLVEVERPIVLTTVHILAIQSNLSTYKPDGTLFGNAVRAEEKSMIKAGVLQRHKPQERTRDHVPEESSRQKKRSKLARQSQSQNSTVNMPPSPADTIKSVNRIIKKRLGASQHDLHAAEAKRKFLTSLPRPKQPKAEPSFRTGQYGDETLLSAGENQLSDSAEMVLGRLNPVDPRLTPPLSEDDKVPLSCFVEPELLNDSLGEPSIFDTLES